VPTNARRLETPTRLVGTLRFAHPTFRHPVIARSPCDEAIQHFFRRGNWIASRSLSSGGHSPDPLARNDDGEMYRQLPLNEL
jgi:hypothetical protein